MQFIPVENKEDLLSRLEGQTKSFVLFIKEGSSGSSCAMEKLKETGEDIPVFVVNVARVKDIHPRYGVNAVPTFLVLENGELKNTVKGCQTPVYYKKIIKGEGAGTVMRENGKPQKRVTVYSTPSCPYCNKLKQYLNKHGIKYTDINVAANQQAAEEMVRKSGQRGVPQTDINGQIIIGFDVPKISKLLDIPTE